jgi:hypothetical protein
VGRYFNRVLIIVLENQDYEAAMRDPYLGSLAEAGANLTDYHGLFHPSYSNYLALVAGREYRTFLDGQIDAPDPTIGRSLDRRGLTWKNYAEGYPVDPDRDPGGCFAGPDFRPTRYARKHVPFLSFVPVRQAERRGAGHVVPAYQFGRDLAGGMLPAYAFYSPNLNNDGHDTGLAYASDWLRGFLEPLRRHPAFMKDGLVVVTFDESAGTVLTPGDPNHIYTVLLGDRVRPGRYAQPANHYNLLRTIEDNFGLPPLADGDGGAKPITGIWRNAPPQESIDRRSPPSPRPRQGTTGQTR